VGSTKQPSTCSPTPLRAAAGVSHRQTINQVCRKSEAKIVSEHDQPVAAVRKSSCTGTAIAAQESGPIDHRLIDYLHAQPEDLSRMHWRQFEYLAG
jgi:hypothetical protein